MQLAIKFDDAFAAHSRYRPRCRRASRVRFRCRPSWAVGDTTFAGPATIWLTAGDPPGVFNYRWTITETDQYCLRVLERPRRECTKRHVVR